jgi:hypothetical protein
VLLSVIAPPSPLTNHRRGKVVVREELGFGPI